MFPEVVKVLSAYRILQSINVTVALVILSSNVASSGDIKLSAGEKTEWGVIFSTKQAALSFERERFFSVTPPFAFWQPTQGDIAQLEAQIGTYLETHPNGSAKKVKQSLSEYRRQYIGYSESGRKFIVVNAFCRQIWRLTDLWLSEVIAGSDGGHCAFRARFDVQQRGFDRFEVNGEA